MNLEVKTRVILARLYEVKECLCFTPDVSVRVRISARGLKGSVFAFRSIYQQL